MGKSEKNRAIDALRNLATVLQSEKSDPDDLIYAFGVVEENGSTVAALLVEFLQQPTS
jgi:hypothetical protein